MQERDDTEPMLGRRRCFLSAAASGGRREASPNILPQERGPFKTCIMYPITPKESPQV